MSKDFEITNLDDVLRDLTKEATKMEAASLKAVAAISLQVETVAKRGLLTRQNKLGRGHEGSPGEYPNRRTGELARSVVTKVTAGFRGYESTTEPGVVYARQLEEGWDSGVNYPYMRPSAEIVRPRAFSIFKSEFQRHYRS